MPSAAILATVSAAAAVTLIIAAIAVALWRLSRPTGTGQSGDLALHEVAADVYLFRGYFSNAAVFVLPSQVVVIDTLTHPHSARIMRDAIEAVTTHPITHVVLTHFHGDHVGGTTVFDEDGVDIVASARTARFMVERDGERRAYTEAFGMLTHGFPNVALPTLTFDGDRHTLALEGAHLDVLHLGAAETEDAVVVHWRERGVLAVGDTVATTGYPFLGAPIVDEGLRDDGAWVGALEAIAKLEPQVLLPGHGVPLLGQATIEARLGLLTSLMTDVMDVTKDEMTRGGGPEAVVARALPRLDVYEGHPGLSQNVVTQRFAVYRAINSLTPAQRGLGWWEHLRRPYIDQAPRGRAAIDAMLHPRPYGQTGVCARARALAKDPSTINDAHALLAHWTTEQPQDAYVHGVHAELMLEHVAHASSIIDASDCFKIAVDRARRAIDLEPGQGRALMVLGVIEVWSAAVLGAPTIHGRKLLERALLNQTLDAKQTRLTRFFLGKAYQFELDDARRDTHLRASMPPVLRPLYPLFRDKMLQLP